MIPCDRCPNHPWAMIFEDETAGDLVCTECGLVVGDRLVDMSSEWKMVKPSSVLRENDPNRVGHAQNPLLNDANLTTYIAPPKNQHISFSNKKNSGGSCKLVKNPDRVKMSNRDRTLIQVFEKIKDLSQRLNVPQNVSNLANDYFEKIHTAKFGNGFSHDIIASACIIMACRKEHVPRTFKEMCGASKQAKKDVGRCLKKVTKLFLETTIPLPNMEHFLSRFSAYLELPYEVEKLAAHIGSRAADLSLIAGSAPDVQAAVAIYMASKELSYNKTPEKVSQVTGINENSIRTKYGVFKLQAAKLLPVEPIGKCTGHFE